MNNVIAKPRVCSGRAWKFRDIELVSRAAAEFTSQTAKGKQTGGVKMAEVLDFECVPINPFYGKLVG